MTRLGPLLSLNGSLLSTRAHRLRCLWGLGGSVRGEEAGITQSKTPAPVPCLKGSHFLASAGYCLVGRRLATIPDLWVLVCCFFKETPEVPLCY